MNANDFWPETLRQYVDAGTGRLRFRRRTLPFSAWLWLTGLAGMTLVALGFTIFASKDRGGSAILLAMFAALLASFCALLFLDWAELERGEREWIAHRGLAGWRRRTVKFRDQDIMTVFVGTTRAWPDFEAAYDLTVEFPALPFAGAPPSLVILNGLGIPELDLAHLGKLILDLAGRPTPSSTNMDVPRVRAD